MCLTEYFLRIFNYSLKAKYEMVMRGKGYIIKDMWYMCNMIWFWNDVIDEVCKIQNIDYV